MWNILSLFYRICRALARGICGFLRGSVSNGKCVYSKRLTSKRDHPCLRAACRSRGDPFLCGVLSCFSNPLDSRKARAASSACGPGAGALPLYPRRGLRGPLFNICFRFCLRQSPHWGHTPSKCPVRGNRPLTLFTPPVLVVLSGNIPYSCLHTGRRFRGYPHTRWYRLHRRLPGPDQSANPRP